MLSDDSVRFRQAVIFAGWMFLILIASVRADSWEVFHAQKLIAHAERFNFSAGHVVSISSNTAAVGSPFLGTSSAGPSSVGEGLWNVFIFERERYRTNEWGLVTEIRTNILFEVPQAFGSSLSLDGDRLAIGAPGVSESGETGKVYICERHAGGANRWGIVQEIVAPFSPSIRDGFGTSVSLDNTNLLVGEIGLPVPEVINPPPQNIAYLLRRAGGVWTSGVFLIGSASFAGDRSGHSVSLDGDVAVVGAPRASNATALAGAVYVYHRNAGGPENWGEVAKLQPGDLAADDDFGWAVSVSGTNIIVGSPRHDAIGENAGAAYLFGRISATNWIQQKKFTSPRPAVVGRFGTGVAIATNLLAIGEPTGIPFGIALPPELDVEGRTFLYGRNTGGAGQWGLIREIRPPNDGAPNMFGHSVSLDGFALLAGAPGDGKSGAGEYAGSAYVFEENYTGVGQWGLVSRLIPTEYETGMNFGTAVAADEDTIAVGAPFKDVFGVGTNGGLVYVFERSWGGVEEWGLTVSLNGNSPFIGVNPERYGSALAIDADRMAVGAPGFVQTNGMYTGSGAVYLHERNSGGTNNWGQVIRKTPATGDVQTNQLFGAAAALRGDVLAVGSPGKSNNTGSVYIYFRNMGGANNWGLFGQLHASPPVLLAQFGSALAFDRGTNLIVGAPFDNTDAALAGAAYIVPATGAVKRLMPTGLTAVSFFGQSVDLDGEWAVAGAYGDADNGSLAGAAYVFHRNQGGAGNWGQFKKIKPTDGKTNQLFGWTVALEGERLVVSARGDSSATNSAGTLYTFGQHVGGSNNWGQLQKVFAASPVTNANLGFSLALSDDTVVAGASMENIDGSPGGGTAFIFDELLIDIRNYKIESNGNHRLDITVTPDQPYRVQRSTNSLVTWTNYASAFTPRFKYHTESVPPPAAPVHIFRLRHDP